MHELSDEAKEKEKKDEDSATEKPKKRKRELLKNERSGKLKFGEQTAEFRGAIQRAQYWMNTYKSPELIPDSAVPQEYDFRNIGGYDFTGPLRDQAECGSCYTMGFVQSVEARLKLKFGHLGD